MRDKKRIDRILKLVRAFWKKHPDLRLLQMLVNVVREVKKEPDYFYVEDSVVEASLKKLLESSQVIFDAACCEGYFYLGDVKFRCACKNCGFWISSSKSNDGIKLKCQRCGLVYYQRDLEDWDEV